jgi:hypothetical protein
MHTVQNAKLAGTHRHFQLRYDLRLFVAPSEDADKTMIAAAKKFVAKAREIDDSLVVYPWFKKSAAPTIKHARSIPENMGAFKTYFHQAQPKVVGGYLYMRVWLGHDKPPKPLAEDLGWWLKNQQFGLYPRSVQAENITGIGWLLYSTKEVNCEALKAAIEKRLGDKFEIGCRYKMISLGRRGAVPKENQIKAIHIECDSEVQFDVKVALSLIYASAKNLDYPNGVRMRLVPEVNSMIAPDTRQNVTRLRLRQDNFQKQIHTAISWDIEALDFIDPQLNRSLRSLIMKIESRLVPGQPLFHVVDETWNQNGYNFSFFPNVQEEARAMMMSLIPFLRHHYNDSIVKWFSSTAQSRAIGAEWNPDKGCVKTFEDEAVSWMMTEDGYTAFDTPLVDTSQVSVRPDPSNLQVAAGPGLINETDSVGTFDPNAPAPSAPTAPPAQLVTGAKANPTPRRVLPAQTGSASNSVGSHSSRSSITESLFSRMSQIEGSLAKVDQMEKLMTLIASKMGLVPEPNSTLFFHETSSIVPPTPPDIVRIQSTATPRADPDSQLARVSDPQSSHAASSPRPDGARPLTHEGAPSTPRTPSEIRQSPTETVNADVSQTDVGRAG